MSVSLYECALLAEDVYNEDIGEGAEAAGWRRVAPLSWGSGFAAQAYARNGVLVVAYRGTDDLQDALDDARMTPLSEPHEYAAVIPALLDAYELDGHGELEYMGATLASLLSNSRVRRFIELVANQLPEAQVQQALDFFDQQAALADFVVGHSLGGALCKTVAQRRDVHGVGCNSPFMAGLRGIQPESLPNILSVNNPRDPLSLATRRAGNLPLGRELQIELPPYPESPPQRPTMAAYTPPVSCPRVGGNNLFSLRGASRAASAVICQVEETVDRIYTQLRRAAEMLRQYPDYYMALLNYLIDVMLYHHGSSTLRQAVGGLAFAHQPLNRHFAGL